MRTIQEIDEKIGLLEVKGSPLILGGLFALYSMLFSSIFHYGFVPSRGWTPLQYKSSLAGMYEISPGYEEVHGTFENKEIKVLPKGALRPIEKPDLTGDIIYFLIFLPILFLTAIVFIHHGRKARGRRSLLKAFNEARPVLADGGNSSTEELYEKLDQAIIGRNKQKKTRIWLVISIHALFIAFIALIAFSAYRGATMYFDKPITPDLELTVYVVLSHLQFVTLAFFLFMLVPVKNRLDARVEVLTWIVSET